MAATDPCRSLSISAASSRKGATWRRRLGPLSLALAALCVPLRGADQTALHFEGTLQQHVVTTWHVRAGCPGPNYGTRTQTGDATMDSVGIPRDISCPVIPFSSGRFAFGFPKEGLLGRLSANVDNPSEIPLVEPLPPATVTVGGTARDNRNAGDEVHTFRVWTTIDPPASTSCESSEASQSWRATSSGNRALGGTVTCPVSGLTIVPGSIQRGGDGLITGFRARGEARAEAEAAHDILYPIPGFRGGIYQIKVEAIYEFKLVSDDAQITSTTPSTSDVIRPTSLQGFEADVNYTLLNEDEGELKLEMIHVDEREALMDTSDAVDVERGTGNQKLEIDPFRIPESGELHLYALLLDKSGSQLAKSQPVIFEITNDIIVDHIEVVQAVQDRNNTVPLVAGKSTMVRVFTKFKHRRRKGKRNVPVRLQGFRGAAEAAGSPMNDTGAGALTFSTVARRFSNTSHNFYLPRQWFEAGDLTLVATVNPERSITELDYDNNETRTTVNFQRRRTFNVSYVKVCVEQAGGASLCPGNNLGAAATLMSKMFPAADNGIRYTGAQRTPIMWKKPLNTDAAQIDLVKFLSKLFHFMRHLRSTQGMDQFVAWVPPGVTVDSTGGMTLGISDPQWSEGGQGRVVWCVDQLATDPLDAEVTLAHEIAHNLGLQHPPTADSQAYSTYTGWPYGTARINEHGWDVPGRRFKRGLPVTNAATKFDFMAYGSPASRFWISPHHYRGLYNANYIPRRNVDASAAPPRQDVAAAGTARFTNGAQEIAIITGTVRKDGTNTQLDPIYRLMSEIAPPAGNPSGAYCLEFLDGTGTLLSDHCFDIGFRNPEINKDLEVDAFSAAVALPAGVARIALVHDGTELAASSASANAPTVAITSPTGGDQWDGRVLRTITWTATDADADPLTFELLYSPDAGANWTPLASDLTATQYALDSGLITGGPQVQLRVLASDGFHTGEATVGPINVVQAPEIRVDGPIDVGDVIAGGSKALSVPVRNTGTGPLTVQSVASDNPVFQVELAVMPLEIPAGDQQTIQARYSPAAEGNDNGTLTFNSNSTNNSALAVAVQGVATDGQTPAIDVAREAVAFNNVPVGDTQTAAVRIGNGSLVDLNVQWTLSGSGFVAGDTPTSFTIGALDESEIIVGFAPGSRGAHNGRLVITSNDPDDSPVEIDLRGRAITSSDPRINTGGVVDAARGRAMVVPGGIASIYGTNLASGVAQATATPLPTELLGVKVLVNGIEAPLYFVAPGQINFQVPFESSSSGELTVVVVRDGVSSYTATATASDFAPAMFMNFAAGEPIIQKHADGSLVSAANRASAGAILRLYLTGIGGLTNPPATGVPTPVDPLAWATTMPTVTVGGAPATVYFCGLSPFFIGLAQIDVGLPDPLPEGATLPLVISFGDNKEEEVTLPLM